MTEHDQDGNIISTEARLWAALLTEKAERLSDTAKLLRTIGHLWFALAVTLLTLALVAVLGLLG